jgi:acyl carrier protein
MSTDETTIQELATEILHAQAGDRCSLLVQYLRRKAAQILNKPPEHVPIDQGFVALGLDSLMLMDIIGAVTQDFKMALYPRELFESPTIETFAEYLSREIAQAHDGAAPSAPVQTQGATAQIARISASQIARPVPAKRIPGIAFLLSSPRAGSTLLRVMLAGHPKLFCPPELHLLPFGTMQERRTELAASYLGEGLERAFMDINQMDSEGATALVERLAEEAAGVQDVYELLQKAAGDRLLVDKSPSYGANIETLQNAEALFEGAKYIHLVRHPYATIESIARRRIDKLVGAQNVDPNAFAEELWATTNSNILDFLQEVDPERAFTVRFEDLVTAPRRVMTDLCSFLDVPFDEAVLKPYAGERMTDGLHEKSVGIGDPNFLNHDAIDPALGDVWRDRKLWRKLGGFAKRVAAELDYELPAQGAPGGMQPEAPEAFEEGRL